MNGKLYVVGIGPGALEHMTFAARAALEASEVVVGYQTYLDFVAPLLEGKDVVASGMRREVERCRQALELTAAGKVVALISSGDAGVYGMAGLVLELADGGGAPGGEAAPEIEIVPGVSAVQAAAARLGAPLMHDFAVISLSDLLTPWELICRRLAAAASADFVVALYNPRSKGRRSQLVEALEILRRNRSPQTPVGIVRNACRDEETVTVSALGTVDVATVDMLSVVIVGNSQTRFDGQGRMVTPRGYLQKNQGSGIRDQERTANDGPHPSSFIPHPSKALFIGGTGSDVGKSVIVAGICRLLHRRGISVAPFKAQNMALNSAVTPQGGEIGRAQALQALACGIPPHTDMNPVLLKPNSATGSQVIVQGRPVGNMDVRGYHAYKEVAFARVQESFARLAARHQVVVLEGAGSIAEINLRAHDITNLRAAAMAAAPVVLVADIDRGGVFAAIVGTLGLLTDEERRQVAGVIINKFRGDASLLRSGIEAIEDRCGVPVLGVVPHLDLQLPEEDSLGLARKKAGEGKSPGKVRIGVVRLPRISNYTDFDALEQESQVELHYLTAPHQVAELDLLILPGTKSTLADLRFLRQHGFDRAIAAFHAAGGRIVGICGGFQMLGRTVTDPLGAESELAEMAGLGLLDVETELQPVKQTHQATAVVLAAGQDAGLKDAGALAGYEIHLGETRRGAAARPLLHLTRRTPGAVAIEDGAVSADGRVWGTYLHGIFDAPDLRRALLTTLGAVCDLRGDRPPSVDAELDRLADHLQAHVDLAPVWQLLGCGSTGGDEWAG